MKIRSFMTVAILAVLALLPADAAFAGHWRNEPGLYKADNRNGDVHFYQCDLTTDYHQVWHDNAGHDLLPTDVVFSELHGCDNIDIRINDWEFGENAFMGWWECHSLVDSNMCDTGHVHLNLSRTANKPIGEKMALMCQEVAHGLGLGHRSSGDTCMAATTADLSKRHFDWHDTDALNAHYP